MLELRTPKVCHDIVEIIGKDLVRYNCTSKNKWTTPSSSPLVDFS